MNMFSEKYGYGRGKEILIEEVSYEIRVRVWNLFYQREIREDSITEDKLAAAFSGKPTISAKIADRLGFITSDSDASTREKLKQYLLNECEWYRVYDFICIHLAQLKDATMKKRSQQYNTILEQEKSGYRVVNGEVAPITNPAEIACIEQAANSQFHSVNQHIQKALELYADIKNPDYENSVKESISAVEAMCCIITGMTGAQATLGAAIKKLKDQNVNIHGAMEQAFLKLYGYTSDQGGIRHGGIDFQNVPAEDAKYMLVSCSAFINYLIEKWSKLGGHN